MISHVQITLERDYVRAQWLLGAAYRLNAAYQPGDVVQAEQHLTEALTRCRKINAVDHEADILLDLARLRAQSADQDQREEALRLAEEALLITERSGYVLQGADVHLLLAQMAMQAGDRAAALDMRVRRVGWRRVMVVRIHLQSGV